MAQEAELDGKDVGGSDSSSDNSHEQAGQTPAESNSVQQEEGKIPYSRFKEVIDEKNNLATKIKDLETRLDREFSREDVVNREAVDAFRGRGLDDATAKFMAETVSQIARREVERRVAPIEDKTSKLDVAQWVNSFAREHDDFQDYSPKMDKVFDSLPEETKTALSASPAGIELLYGYVKNMESESIQKKSYEKGSQDAYSSRRNKSAISGAQSSSSKNDVFPLANDISEMTDEEYQKKREWLWKNTDKIARK